MRLLEMFEKVNYLQKNNFLEGIYYEIQNYN